MVAEQTQQALSKHKDKIIIFLLPLFLAFLNSNWIFTPATGFLPDAWFYLAYFRHFNIYAPAYPSNTYYFVERITWNVPGYYIYQVLPPLQANYVLHLIVYYIAVFSLYGILTILFNRRTAILSTLFMGSYPWFLRAVGWDYVDGIGIALLLFLIYILTLVKTSTHWKYLIFFAGIIHATLIITNLFWVGLFPGWVVYFLYISGSLSRGKIWQLFDYFTLGNLALTAICALYYHFVTGEYYFLKNNIAFAGGQIHNEQLSKIISIIYGHMPSLWHILPILTVAGVLIRIKKLVKDDHYPAFTAIALLFCLTYGSLIFWHFFTLPYLNIFLYSSFTIPAIFMLLGTLLAGIVDKISDRLFNIMVGITFLLLTAPFFLVVIFPTLENWLGNSLLLILFSLIFILGISLPKKEFAIFPILVSLSALSFLVGLNSYVFISDPLKGRDTFVALINASNAIDSHYPEHKYGDFRLWYREDVNYAAFFNLSAIYLYPWGNAIGDPQAGRKPPPVLIFRKADKLQDKDNIIIVSNNPNAIEIMAEANSALAYRDATLELNATEKFQEGSLHFTLYYTHVNMVFNENSRGH